MADLVPHGYIPEMNEQGRRKLAGFTRVYVGFGAALVILALMDVGSMGTAHLLKVRVQWQTHTYEVLDRASELTGSLRAVEAAHRGYIASGDEHFIEEYRTGIDSVRRAVAVLDTLTSDNSDQTARLDKLKQLIGARLAYMDSANALRAGANNAPATLAMRRGSESSLRTGVYRTIEEVGEAERDLLTHRNERLNDTLFAVKWITIVGLAFSTFLVIASIGLIRIEIKRRRAANRDLAASEERLRDFLESASDLIQSSSADGRLVYANKALLDTLGYRADEVIGQPSEMFFAPEEVEKGRQLFDRLLAGESLTDIDTVYLRKDGRRVHVAGSSNCRFENGKPVATRTILRDVTRQREVDSMKDEFVSIVSHELRTPLTSIRGALGLLAGGMLGDVPNRGKRMLDVAIANTDRLVRLINDILDVERIESGAVPMSRRRVSLNEIFDQVDELMQPLAHKADIALEIERLDVDLNADADRIVQTLTNLVGNSIKFSPAGTSVRIETARDVEHVHIRVCDEGRGIPADMLETVFARFQQVDARDNREKGGSGLGLAISRSIIEQHDGRIWAAGELKKGAIFHILLPIMPPATTTVDLKTESSERDAPLVMICDDDADVRSVLGGVLEARGYRVSAAADGETAIAMAAEQQPSVILLDLLMPGGIDGWQTMAALKERPDTSHIPIIIVSGSAESTGIPAAAGDEPRMRKPVDPASLVSAIEHALAQWGAGADVLIVEDDIDLARVLVEFLRKHGLRPVHASNGREAVQMSQKAQPSLIILDLMLPDTDGFAVVDWLKQHDRLCDVPILVYTARDLDEQQRARLDIAPELLFTKSRMPPEELVQRVAAMVSRITLDNDGARS
jgi:PAS domain S-box-containing protein